MRNPSKQLLDRVWLLLRKDGSHARTCSREDSNLHGSPHTVLSRTRLPVPPRERERGKVSKKWDGVNVRGEKCEGERPSAAQLSRIGINTYRNGPGIFMTPGLISSMRSR